ncbi:MAG: HlyD family secretion protein [Gammaproteobacteria bacterium]
MFGAYVYVLSGRFVSTENAYVKADKIAITMAINGRVAKVLVHENDAVKAGQVLFELDTKPYRIAFARADAQLGVVALEIESYRTAYRQQLAELQIAKDNLAFAEREFQRQEKLSQTGLIAQAKYDEARHQLRQAQQKIAAIQEDITHALTNLGGNPDLPTTEHPRYRQALAERDQAQFDIDRSTMRSPADGVVSNIDLEAGEYVQAGRPIFSVVTNAVWITANLKETDLTHVAPGQKATVRADAYPDQQWSAVIASISPATGAEFALLPPQNASGNWVKVVQRIPVRLVLENPGDNALLRAGMSVHVEIDTGYHRPLPEIVQTALAWLRIGNETANASSAPAAPTAPPAPTSK